jgi:tetratricopeptide (TPR) repeat protein
MQSYKVARDLELQGNKQEALVAFEQIAKAWPDGLDDEATRIDALRVDIQAAEAAYAAGDAAEQKGELAAALEQFKTARTYYAKLRDVAQRIEQIEKKLAAPPSTEGAGAGTGSGS